MRLGLIGNCQVQSMAVVARLALDAPHIDMLDYSTPQSRQEDHRLAFAESLAESDIIFCQRASLSHTNEADLRRRYPGRVVVVANFYFRGLFPDSCYVGDFENRLTDPTMVNSLIILDAYRRGLSRAQALGAFHPDNLHRLGIFDAWDSSMAEMRAREADGVVDIPSAALMEEACRRYPAFLTMNHPGLPFMADYMQRAFRHAGLPTHHFNPLAVPDPLAGHDTTPVLDEVAEVMGLPYRTTQRWKINALGAEYLTREDLIDAFYESYDVTSPARLVVHSPTDLLARLRATPELAYLADPSMPAPRHEAGMSTPARADQVTPQQVAALRHAVLQGNEKLNELTDNIAELRRYTHMLHSFAQIADPKIERMVATLPLIDGIADRTAGMQAPALVRLDRRMDLLARLAVLGGGAMLAGLLLVVILLLWRP